MRPRTSRETGVTFTIKRRFEAPREKVFEAWTKPEILKHWWCPDGWTPKEIEVDLRVGGSFRIGMQRSTGGEPVYVSGNFEEVDAPEMLSYTWQWENAFEHMPQTRVLVRFRDLGGATELSLTHHNLPEILICLQHRSGWLAAWERMSRLLT
jgi:uncharacterized protein YndB with AHSA1/START domain